MPKPSAADFHSSVPPVWPVRGMLSSPQSSERFTWPIAWLIAVLPTSTSTCSLISDATAVLRSFVGDDQSRFVDGAIK